MMRTQLGLCWEVLLYIQYVHVHICSDKQYGMVHIKANSSSKLKITKIYFKNSHKNKKRFLNMHIIHVHVQTQVCVHA